MACLLGGLCGILAFVFAGTEQWTAPVRVVVAETGAGQAVTGPPRAAVPDRGIAANESGALDVCLNYVDAQRIYFRSGHGFAQKIRSSQAKRDGLYWPPDETQEESPMGPRFAGAAAAELPPGAARPWFGYHFKILPARQPALIAWPAEYGVTGVQSFVVTPHGDVYAKDLGAGTPRIVPAMTAFSPDPTWKAVDRRLQ